VVVLHIKPLDFNSLGDGSNYHLIVYVDGCYVYLGFTDMRLLDMTFEEWVEKYKPIPNRIDDNASFQDENGVGIMFETYGEELDYVLEIANSQPNRVWTYMDGDEGTFIGDRYHLVNRIGYFITAVPCEEDTWVQVSIDTYEEYDEDTDYTGQTESNT
jgi:hypothetical protein